MNAYPKTCPNAECGADLTQFDALETDELTPGTCYGWVDEDGGLELQGDTKMCWDAQETERVKCAACGNMLPDLPSDLVYRFSPSFDEDTAPSFASLLRYVASDLGAPNFAADLAIKGASSLDVMAGRWTDCDLEPSDFADVLSQLAKAYA